MPFWFVPADSGKHGEEISVAGVDLDGGCNEVGQLDVAVKDRPPVDALTENLKAEREIRKGSSEGKVVLCFGFVC